MTLSAALWSVVVPVGFVIFMIVVFSNARLRLLAERRGVVPVVLVMFLGSLLGGGAMLLAAIRVWATAPLAERSLRSPPRSTLPSSSRT